MYLLLGISSLFCLEANAEELTPREPLPNHIIRVPDTIALCVRIVVA